MKKDLKPQSKLKRIFKNIAKTIGFAALYLIVAIATTAGIIFLSPSGGDKDDTFTIPVQLTKIMNNFQLVKALDVDLNVDVETPLENYNITLDGKLDINDGFENMKAEGLLSVCYDEKNVDVNFTYSDSEMFVEALNGKFLIKTDSLIGGLSEIATLLELDVPDLAEMGLENLDANTILSFLSDLKEEKGSNSITININVPIVGQIQILCDMDYSVKAVYLPKFDVSEGTSIKFSSSLNYPKQNVISVPTQQNYIDATEFVSMATSAIKTLKQDGLGFYAKFNIDNALFDGRFDADLKTMSASFETSMFDKPLKLVATNHEFYLDFGNTFLKFAFDDVKTLEKFLFDQFGMKTPIGDIIDILTSLQDGTLMTTLREKLDENDESFDLNSIDLGKIENFTKLNDGFQISIRDLGVIDVKTKDQKLSSLAIVGPKFDAKLEMRNPLPVSISDKNYADLSIALPALNALFDTFKNDTITATAEIEENGNTVKAQFSVDKLHSTAYLTAQLFGDQLEIFTQDNRIFANFKGLKFYATKNDLEYASKNFNLGSSVVDIVNVLLNNDFNSLTSIEECDGGLLVTFAGDLKLKLSYDQSFNSATLYSKDFNASIKFVDGQPNLPKPRIADYTSIRPILEHAIWIQNYFKNETCRIGFNAKFDKLNLSGQFSVKNGQLALYATTTLDGVKMEIRILDGVVYFNTLNSDDEPYASIKFDLKDSDAVLTFLNEQFGIDLSQPQDLLENVMGLTTENFDLTDLLTDLTLNYSPSADVLKIALDKYTLSITFRDGFLTNAAISGDNLTLNAQPIYYNGIFVPNYDYFDIVDAMPFVSKINTYLSSRKYALSASAEIYRGTQKICSASDIALQLDATKDPQFYASANILDSLSATSNLNAALCKDKLYFNYNRLALSLGANGFKDILAMALRTLNLNENALDDLLGLSQNANDVDISSLTKLLPNMSSASPASLLKFVKSLNVDAFNRNILIVCLDGAALSNDERASDMKIYIETDGNSLKQINVENFYTGSDDLHFDLEISAKKFTGITQPDLSHNYLDISGAEELVKAFANTATYSTFKISGTFTVDLKPGIIHIKRDIPFTAQIALNNFTLQNMIVKIGPIPVVDIGLYNVNNDTNWTLPTIKNRMLSVYYQDDYFYFYRTENRSRGDSYKKAIKVHAETVMDDFCYYLQWGTGLNDKIMEEIRATIEHDVNIGNVVTAFSQNNGFYTTTLNMQEITGKDKMGSLIVGLGTSSRNGKKVLSSASIELDLPLIAGTTLYLKSDDIHIEQGINLNTSPIKNFAASFASKGREIVEYEAYNDNWTAVKEKEFTVKFDANAEIFDDMNYKSVSGKAGTPFTPPVLSYRSVGKNVSGTDYTLYKFDGWYTSPNYEADTKVTSFTIPRKNVTLYAKWNVSYAYRTIYFYSEKVSGKSPSLLGKQYGKVDSQLKCPSSSIAELREQTYTGYVDGVYGKYKLKQRLTWVDALGRTLTRIPNESTNVYAYYETYEVVKIG